MREWEIGAVENIHGALPYIRFAPILALVGVGLNRIGKDRRTGRTGHIRAYRLLETALLSVALDPSSPRNLSTTLRHRRFLFTDSFLLLWKWRVG